MIEAVMPEGVEHESGFGYQLKPVVDVIEAVMPEGVEHTIFPSASAVSSAV